MKPKLTDDQKELAKALLKGGYTRAKVAEYFGVTLDFLKGWCVRNKFRGRGRPRFARPSEKNERIMRLFNAGMLYREISKEVGVSKARVGIIVKRWRTPEDLRKNQARAEANAREAQYEAR